MANIEKLKHLEHLEDEMLNYGVEGCKSIVSFLKELLSALFVMMHTNKDLLVQHKDLHFVLMI